MDKNYKCPDCGYELGTVQELIDAARHTLTEQRREFAYGDVADLDRLEDALDAFE